MSVKWKLDPGDTVKIVNTGRYGVDGRLGVVVSEVMPECLPSPLVYNVRIKEPGGKVDEYYREHLELVPEEDLNEDDCPQAPFTLVPLEPGLAKGLGERIVAVEEEIVALDALAEAQRGFFRIYRELDEEASEHSQNRLDALEERVAVVEKEVADE